MRIGITFDLKTPGKLPDDVPDDLQEEFDGPHTIEAIANVLHKLGHEVILLGDGREFLEKVLQDTPDFVFNFAEGHGVSRSREARVPAVLEMLGIPFTGSDPLTMAVTLDKDIAKQLVRAGGVNVPQGVMLEPSAPLEDFALPYPVIVKPAWEGSSKGIRNRCLVQSSVQLADVVRSIRKDHGQPILIEEFIQGDELTVGIIGNDPPKIFGVMRITPREPVEHFVYSLEVKRDYRRMVRYECPAPLPPAVMKSVENAALTAFRALGCRDVARIDFRMKGNVPCFIELNPLPGLNPDDSDLVIMAGLIDCNYARLIESILTAALKRCGRTSEKTPKLSGNRQRTSVR